MFISEQGYEKHIWYICICVTKNHNIALYSYCLVPTCVVIHDHSAEQNSHNSTEVENLQVKKQVSKGRDDPLQPQHRKGRRRQEPSAAQLEWGVLWTEWEWRRSALGYEPQQRLKSWLKYPDNELHSPNRTERDAGGQTSERSNKELADGQANGFLRHWAGFVDGNKQIVKNNGYLNRQSTTTRQRSMQLKFWILRCWIEMRSDNILSSQGR
mgnify:CR=1 FL=1